MTAKAKKSSGNFKEDTFSNCDQEMAGSIFCPFTDKKVNEDQYKLSFAPYDQ